MTPLTSAERRQLKAQSQRLKPLLRVGRHGVSGEFLRVLDEALAHHSLVKVKFDEFREDRKTLAPQMAWRTASELIWMVGHVAVLYRPGS
jgi:RNA-binding protein